MLIYGVKYYAEMRCASRERWFSVTLNLSVLETMLLVASMFVIGFLEEIVFCRRLFRVMAKNDLTVAIIVVSITFGIGNIVNPFNANGQNLDTAEYAIDGLDPEFRPLISPFIATATMHERLSKHYETYTKHNLDYRRYYRQFAY